MPRCGINQDLGPKVPLHPEASMEAFKHLSGTTRNIQKSHFSLTVARFGPRVRILFWVFVCAATVAVRR
jgi:hypothetical protein